MLQIKTFIAPSKIHGIDLFADEDIKKGEELTLNYNDFDREFE